MLMEDAGNIRHNLKEYFHVFFGNTKSTNVSVEMVFYTLVALPMILAVLRYGAYLRHSVETIKYLIIGYAAYAVASFASVSRDIYDWYFRVGAWIHEGLLHGQFYDRSTYYINFLIMDTLIEESIELIGAAGICAALLSFYYWIEHNEELIDIPASNCFLKRQS